MCKVRREGERENVSKNEVGRETRGTEREQQQGSRREKRRGGRKKGRRNGGRELT